MFEIIGRLYTMTALAFFAAGGVMALLMRAELARPGMQFLGPKHAISKPPGPPALSI